MAPPKCKKPSSTWQLKWPLPNSDNLDLNMATQIQAPKCWKFSITWQLKCLL